jgi:hypothetical protein
VVLSNRRGGPERCIGIVEQRAPDGFVDLDAVISRAELEEISRSYKRTAGFDPEILNNRPSLGVAQHGATAVWKRDGMARKPDGLPGTFNQG